MENEWKYYNHAIIPKKAPHQEVTEPDHKIWKNIRGQTFICQMDRRICEGWKEIFIYVMVLDLHCMKQSFKII